MKKNRDKPLDAKVEDDKLIIEIGIDTLAGAFENGPDNNPYDDKIDDFIKLFKVVNCEGFAHDVAGALNSEREDGSSILTDLLDKACIDAVYDGSEHVVELKKKKIAR